MRQPWLVVLDEVVLVEPAAVAGVEEVREVEHAGPDVLEVGLAGSVAPHVVLDVVGEVPGRVGRQVLDAVGAALGDPEQVELELDELAVALLEQDVVDRRTVGLLVQELEVVVVVEELQVVLARELARLVELLREPVPDVDVVVRPREPRPAGELLPSAAAYDSVSLYASCQLAGKLKSGPSWPETARRPAALSSDLNCAAVHS